MVKKVTVISHRSRIADCTVYPLRKNKRALQERGYDVRICYQPSEKAAADIICLSSVYVRKWWKNPERVFAFIGFLRQHCGRLIYLDEFDSTGVTHFQLLPHVDRYLKKQLLKDKSLYTRRLYGDRLFTDFYHEQFNVSDDESGHQSDPLDTALAHKVGLLWNIGLGDMQGDILSPLLKRVRRRLPPSYRVRFTSPRRPRPIDCMFRGRHSAYKNTVRFHRTRLVELLDGMQQLRLAMHGRVSRAQYRREMQAAKLVISPFGWGELGVRDFEAWIYGAALLKPDMSHMETWPDIFLPGITYRPLSWDFTDFEQAVAELLHDEHRRLTLALNGQEAYRHMISDKGMEEFCSWFIRQIEG